MATTNRSVSDVLQDIIRNIQDIVRSEVRLAKTEVREEVFKARHASVLIGAGALSGTFSAFFLLFSIVYALSRVVPDWAAALIVGVALAIATGALLSKGAERFKHVHPAPDKTIESLKENVEWAKRHAR
jgi:Putative Actinobacterial Holin-X, holin superfamily III